MFCPNCGGEYANWALKCPYCGSVNDAGSERVYMEHLEEIRNRLDLVDEEAENMYRRGMGESQRRILKLICIALAAAVLLSTGAILITRYFAGKQEAEYVRQSEWAREEYPKLDAWYEAGEYDQILEESRSLLGTDYSIYDWEHETFVCQYYEYKKNIEAGEALMEDNVLKKGDEWILEDAIYSSIYLLGIADEEELEKLIRTQKYNGCYGLSEEEAEFVRGYREDAKHFLGETLGLCEAEIEEALKTCLDDGFVKWSACDELADEIIRKYRKE